MAAVIVVLPVVHKPATTRATKKREDDEDDGRKKQQQHDDESALCAGRISGSRGVPGSRSRQRLSDDGPPDGCVSLLFMLCDASRRALVAAVTDAQPSASEMFPRSPPSDLHEKRCKQLTID